MAVFRTRFIDTPELFCKKDWKRNDAKKQRQKIIEIFEEYVKSFQWNTPEEKVPVVPCITVGTPDEIQSIVRSGFDMGASATFGKFGHGVYVTTSTMDGNTEEGNRNVILVSYTIPGNVFPLISEDLKKEKPLQGNPVKNGYNSHLVLLDAKTNEVVDDVSDDVKHVGQFVIEQPSQLIPALVIHLQPSQS